MMEELWEGIMEEADTGYGGQEQADWLADVLRMKRREKEGHSRATNE